MSDLRTAFERLRGDDGSAIDPVMAEYGRLAFATAFHVLRDSSLAEEAVQDAFVRVWQRARQFDPERGNERTWILSIVRNSAIDTARKRSRMLERSIDDVPAVYGLRHPDDTWQSVLAGMTEARVRQALDELPAEQREVIVKAYYEGVRPVDIARQLRVPEGTIRSRLRLGLAKLREILAPLREELTQ